MKKIKAQYVQQWFNLKFLQKLALCLVIGALALGGEAVSAKAYQAGFTPHIPDGNKGITGNYSLATSQSLTLASGWNLVSFNLHPTSTAITDVLASVAGKYDLVYAWDATGAHSSAGNWMRYAPGIPGNTLSTLDETQGFWIRMTSAGTLDITGTAPTMTNISLVTTASGWNLVGYPSDLNLSLPGALTEHGVTAYSLVYAYHANDTEHGSVMPRAYLGTT